MAKLQVAMTSVLRMRETEVGEKDGEIEQLRCDLQQIQVRKPCTLCIHLCRPAVTTMHIVLCIGRQTEAAGRG